MKVTVCIGSSCHLKGSRQVIEQLQELIARYHIENEVVLTGSFCIGKCNKSGVSVQIDNDIYVGVTAENFREFFRKNILDVIESERK